MIRKLSMRETVMACILGVLLIMAGYQLMFRAPALSRIKDYNAAAEDSLAQSDVLDVQVIVRAGMLSELDEIFQNDPDPLSMSQYDNLKNIVTELNKILKPMEECSISFGKLSESDGIVRRPVNVSFSCGSYAAAKNVLKQLDGSIYRCLLESVSVSMPDDAGAGDGKVRVQASLTYFEYKEQ